MSEPTTTDPNEMIQCPHSAALQDPLAEGYIPHFASRREIAENRGVCVKCAAHFRRHHRAAQHGRDETPASYETLRRVAPNVITDHVAVSEDGPEIVEDFDLESVERALDELKQSPADVRAEACELIRKIVSGLFTEPITPTTLRGSFVRFVILAAAIAPDAVPLNQVRLAALLDMTKANVSKHQLKLQDMLGVKFYNTRPESARNSMRMARLEHCAATPGKESFNPAL